MAAKEQSTNSLDPSWTARIYGKTTGEDFLGLRAVGINILSYLIPGIITTTPRARYYAFYSWLLVEYAHDHPRGWSLGRFIRRREQIFALANIAHTYSMYNSTSVAGLIGQIKLRNHWRSYNKAKSVPLSVDNYVKAQGGGYDIYGGVMWGLGITGTAEGNGSTFAVSSKGQALAKSFAQAIKRTTYYRQRKEYDTAKSIPRAVLEEYGKKCHLDYLANKPDRDPTLEALFAFSAPHILPLPDTDLSSVGNMRGTLGLMLDMIKQATGYFHEYEFRQAIAYGLCEDYAPYQPADPLRPFLAHWQMFQLREYYIYALYALWVYFLRWLRLEGPQTYKAFQAHLNQTIDLTAVAAKIGVTLLSRSPDAWKLTDWLDSLLDACQISGHSPEDRCQAFAQQSQVPLNEDAIFWLLDEAEPNDPTTYLGTTWLLLSALYLRLRGLQMDDSWGAWHWAQAGGARRRSMALFVRDISNSIAASHTVLEAWTWLFRDYIIAQHIITALEKWRTRKVNTFHFNYEKGVFEWVYDDWTGFSASRFRQAYDMLYDLGLYEVDPEDETPRLTSFGRQTLQRVLESLSGENTDHSAT
jgi:hypothetical protein